MPSSRGRGWYCSAAARLQPPVDERPARTAPGFNRRCWSRRRGSRRGRTRRSPALRGRRGASFFYVDREHGHARRARWAARIPRTPALGTCSHAPLSTSPPTTLRTADRSASEPALASEAPSCSAISPRLPTRAAAWGFEPASATPGRTGGARWRGTPTPVRAGSSRPRGPLELDPPAAPTAYWSQGLGALAFGSVGPAIDPSCTEDSVDSVMPRSLEFGIKKTVDTFGAPRTCGP